MDISQIAQAAFPAAMFVVMVTIGLGLQFGDTLSLLEKPGFLLRAVLSMFVIMPAVMMLITYFGPIAVPAEAALIALSVSPMLPVLPNDLAKLGMDKRQAVSLELASVVVALVAAPLAFWLVARITGFSIDVPAGKLMTSLATGVLLPILLGMGVNLLFPPFAARIATPLFKAGMVVLTLALLVTLWATRALIAAQFNWLVVLAVLALVLGGLAVGYALGGPTHEGRAALGLTTASRHPGFAIALGAAVAPRSVAAVAGVVLLYFILRTLIAAIYAKRLAPAGSGGGDA